MSYCNVNAIISLVFKLRMNYDATKSMAAVMAEAYVRRDAAP